MFFDNYSYLYDLFLALESLESKGMDRFRVHAFQKHGDGTVEAPDGQFNLTLTLEDIRRCMESSIEFEHYIKVVKKIKDKEI
jgi:hypothetical protein